MSQILRTARLLAAEHPGAVLVCPVCGGALKGGNLERHLAKLHPDAIDPTDELSWHGLGFHRGRLWVDDDELRLRRTGGLRRRRLAGIDRITAGATIKSQADPIMATYDDVNAAGIDHRAGGYLRAHSGRRSITVRCRSGSPFRKVWTGWEQGGQRRRWDITLAPGDFAALQYALTRIGPLRLRDR